MGLILLTAFCPRQVAMGAAQLGFLATFMSDPMISGFTTGSAVLVVISQVKHILGLKVPQIPAPLAAPKVNNVILCIHKKILIILDWHLFCVVTETPVLICTNFRAAIARRSIFSLKTTKLTTE